MYDDPRNEQLEAVIRADPSDREAYLVYADWLEARGDVRAALIRQQCATPNATSPLLTEHRRYLLGPLSACASSVFWRNGFIYSGGFSDAAGPIVTNVENLLAHPSARFLIELAITSKYLPAVLAAIAAAAPPSLRMLSLATEAETDLALLAPVLPQLGFLSLHGPFTFTTLALPQATAVLLRIRDLPAASVRAIASLQAPRIARLAVDLTGSAATIDDLAPLFARADLPALTDLDLLGARCTDDICERLLASPLAGQLRTLSLRRGALTTRGADRLAELTGLEELDIADTPLADDDKQWLAEALGITVIGVRYDSADE
ncbi:MAG: TIGR02996 domain-containing protein [Kofleriaceae bacterium]